mmetsp:Transcript_30560/g.71367  ORF Transcript_30560/g.71367 Transcript_30560/m.71367 type:complete len:547 (+) Transcript_30560:51-1691(+)
MDSDLFGSQATAAIQAAADELAKQAGAIGNLATAKDPWAGEDEDDDGFADDLPPEDLVPLPVGALQAWGKNSTNARLEELFDDPPSASSSSLSRPPPFAPDGALNEKIYLLQGDLLSLQVDALVAPCAANFSPGSSTVFANVQRQGGRDLRIELRHLDACRSGEVRMVKAFGLPCSKLLITVGPKYKEKFQVAAENALNGCVRECLQGMTENSLDLRSVAIPCRWYSKGFPLDEHAQVVLRSLRRCLERLRDKIDAVVLVGESAEEVELYDALLPSYFPRTDLEARKTSRDLPESCWSLWGEVSLQERRIPLSNSLVRSVEDSDEDPVDGSLFSAADETDKSFLQAREDADKTALQRLEVTLVETAEDDVARQVCMRYIRRARELSLEEELARDRFVYGAGQDSFGRHIVVVIGARLPSLGIREQRTLPRFVRELEDLHGANFVIIYANSGVATADTAILEVLQEMMSVVMTVKRYHDSFAQLYVLHPGLWFRAAFAVGSVFSNLTAKVWNETIYSESVAELAGSFSVSQLRLPEWIIQLEGSGAI